MKYNQVLKELFSVVIAILHVEWIPFIYVSSSTDMMEETSGPFAQNLLGFPCVFIAVFFFIF
jgi:hypothetical protein